MSDLVNNNQTATPANDFDQPQLAAEGNNEVNKVFESWLIEYRDRLAEVLEEDTKHSRRRLTVMTTWRRFNLIKCNLFNALRNIGAQSGGRCSSSSRFSVLSRPSWSRVLGCSSERCDPSGECLPDSGTDRRDCRYLQGLTPSLLDQVQQCQTPTPNSPLFTEYPGSVWPGGQSLVAVLPSGVTHEDTPTWAEATRLPASL